MVGVDTQVFHEIVNCGASGAITGIGNVFPREVLRLVELCERAAKGDPEARRLALELENLGCALAFGQFHPGRARRCRSALRPGGAPCRSPPC